MPVACAIKYVSRDAAQKSMLIILANEPRYKKMSSSSCVQREPRSACTPAQYDESVRHPKIAGYPEIKLSLKRLSTAGWSDSVLSRRSVVLCYGWFNVRWCILMCLRIAQAEKYENKNYFISAKVQISLCIRSSACSWKNFWFRRIKLIHQSPHMHAYGSLHWFLIVNCSAFRMLAWLLLIMLGIRT